MATLRENNAQLEVAAQVANESLDTMRSDFARVSSLNTELQQDLQKAEQYSDELRGKLAKLDLAVEALKDSKSLEGKMNGATANVWRDFMRDSGNTNEYDLPDWLQSSRERSSNGNQSGENNSAERQFPPKPLQLTDTRVFVVTEDNFEQFVEEFTREYGELAFVALSMKDYENLALNVAEIKRYLNQQREIILYYEKAVTEDSQ